MSSRSGCTIKRIMRYIEPAIAEISVSATAAAESAIVQHHIGRCVRMFSSAGHDAMNAAQAGIDTAMIFIPSGNGGAAHTPDEYTPPDDLERGARALAALTYKLANKFLI